MTDGYKIGLAFKDVPLDLSNYMLIRTRENILLRNKQLHKDVFRPKSFKDNFTIATKSSTEKFTKDSLKAISRDLE